MREGLLFGLVLVFMTLKNRFLWVLMVSFIAFCVCTTLKTIFHIPLAISVGILLFLLVGWVAYIVHKELQKNGRWI